MTNELIFIGIALAIGGGIFLATRKGKAKPAIQPTPNPSPKPVPTLNWPDRRPIGMVMLANWRESAIPPNMRNWYLQGTYDYSNFESALISHIDASISGAKNINAQAIIIWDSEGQQYPHPITFLGSPELAPDSVDIAFKMIKDAGLKTGICIRPTVVRDSWPQHYNEDSFTVLDRKVAYAINRWRCSIFYVDSNKGDEYDAGYNNTNGDGRLTPATVFVRLAAKYPQCLFMPVFNCFSQSTG